jgi:hypothetical protein
MRSIDPPRSEAQLVGLVKPVSNAESSVTYEKYVPKRILCQKQTEAGPRLTEKMAAQYQQNRARLKVSRRYYVTNKAIEKRFIYPSTCIIEIHSKT